MRVELQRTLLGSLSPIDEISGMRKALCERLFLLVADPLDSVADRFMIPQLPETRVGSFVHYRACDISRARVCTDDPIHAQQARPSGLYPTRTVWRSGPGNIQALDATLDTCEATWVMDLDEGESCFHLTEGEAPVSATVATRDPNR
ncbi:MAG TPA: hypothetical protein VNA31_04330 [bacterium]|nr:hypothetical protein [bacterium]